MQFRVYFGRGKGGFIDKLTFQRFPGLQTSNKTTSPPKNTTPITPFPEKSPKELGTLQDTARNWQQYKQKIIIDKIFANPDVYHFTNDDLKVALA